jgi:hypothetical protein
LRGIDDLGLKPACRNRIGQLVGGVLGQTSRSFVRAGFSQRIAHGVQAEKPDGFLAAARLARSLSITHVGFFILPLGQDQRADFAPDQVPRNQPRACPCGKIREIPP